MAARPSTTASTPRKSASPAMRTCVSRTSRARSNRMLSCGKAVVERHIRHAGDRRAEQGDGGGFAARSEEHTSELQSLMRISYAVFCLKKKKSNNYISKS